MERTSIVIRASLTAEEVATLKELWENHHCKGSWETWREFASTVGAVGLSDAIAERKSRLDNLRAILAAQQSRNEETKPCVLSGEPSISPSTP